jgi:hypothetical protein
MLPWHANAQVPELFRNHSFNAATLAKAVNHYVSLGEEAAVGSLTELVNERKHQQGIDIPERIGWVCRILFSSKTTKPLRPPLYGALSLPFNTMPLENWPHYPIAHSGNTYFVLSEGYMLAGLPENPKDYLAYCLSEGVFRSLPIAVPSKSEAQKDALSLRQSPAWQRIKWKDRAQGFSYAMSESSHWQYIQAQADAIN